MSCESSLLTGGEEGPTNLLQSFSAWIPNTDLTPLDPETCKNVSEKGKQKHLVAAFKVAAENHDLQHFKNLLADHQRAVQQEFEDREAAAAEKAALKAQKDAEKEEKKNKRKSIADGTDIEMGDADDDKKPKSAKKRKKDAESDAEGGKVSLAADCLRCRC